MFNISQIAIHVLTAYIDSFSFRLLCTFHSAAPFELAYRFSIITFNLGETSPTANVNAIPVTPVLIDIATITLDSIRSKRIILVAEVQ